MTMSKQLCVLLNEVTALCPLKKSFITRCKNHFECDIKREYRRKKKC